MHGNLRAILTLVVIPCLYIREVTSKRKRGPDVTYVQLCESEWDAQKGSARSRILHSFGRKDDLDVRQIARLSAQLRAYLDTENLGESVEGVDLTDPLASGDCRTESRGARRPAPGQDLLSERTARIQLGSMRRVGERGAQSFRQPSGSTTPAPC